MAAVGVDESLCQLNTSILQAGLQSTVCTCQKVSVTDCNIEQEPKYVLVILPAFEAYVVVASHLVVALDSTHALDVAYHRQGCIVNTLDPSFFLLYTVSVTVGSELVAATVTGWLS